MKIVVLSDTHSRDLPAQLLSDIEKADLIVHAGDFCALQDLENLRALKEVKAVYGNMDEADLREELPAVTTFSCAGKTVGLFHGEGRGEGVLPLVRERFKGKTVDAVIFGHSHSALCEEIDGVLYFNPGSPNDKVFAPYCSYGILDITEEGIKGKIVKVKE